MRLFSEITRLLVRSLFSSPPLSKHHKAPKIPSFWHRFLRFARLPRTLMNIGRVSSRGCTPISHRLQLAAASSHLFTKLTFFEQQLHRSQSLAHSRQLFENERFRAVWITVKTG